MIRINLLPTKKRSKGRAAPTDGLEKRGGIYAMSLLLFVAAIGLVLYFVLDNVQTETAKVSADTVKVQAEVKRIKELIDEERLAQRRAELERIRAAQEKVEKQQRTPVYVMHELANILSSGLEPEYDEEWYRKCKAKDANCALDPSWDGDAVWLKQAQERQGGLLEISGRARDAADLSEFVKRLRVSARFTDVSHPKYSTNTKDESGQYLDFVMTARVAYWD